ncbi:MAG: hypothetical protein KBC57_10965 [Neisseriaceae bacterium]|nr:hypothetical protein [Neisseriaceae bacterium]MBP6862860.1 hypothetical protein [Neisseriaceae bacterium]
MYIIWVAYLYVVLMFSVVQESIARMIIYMVFLAVIPTIVVGWMLRQKRRNQKAKQQSE